MFAADPSGKPSSSFSNSWPMPFLLSLILLCITGCSYLCECEPNQDSEKNTVISSDETIYLDTSESVPADKGTTAIVAASNYPLETNDEQPSKTAASQSAPITQAPNSQATNQVATQASAGNTAATASNQGQFACPEPANNHYKKSIAFVSFPRTVQTTSNLGVLHKVEQQLPLLIGTNLTNRQAVLVPIYLHERFISTNTRGEANTAVQVQTLSQRHRVQFFVSGEVDDMAMTFPDTVENPSYYTRFVSGTHNLLHVNSLLDKRSRAFSFKVEVRDGFTGQVVFTNQYRTIGKWKPAPHADVGFGSPRFWETDYGDQIQHLVAKASDDLANVINCQPYVSRVESTPGQLQVVVQSGSNNGLHLGDTLDLYQLVHQPISGEYQRFDTRLIKRTGYIHLTETYPSHSVGKVVNETLLGGQYLIKAR